MMMLEYYRHKISLLALFILSSQAHCYVDGILNTQTVAGSEAIKVKKNIAGKKDEIEREINKYKKAIEENNQKIKLSIKQIKMVIELKRNTLIEAEKLLHNTTNKKELK